MAEPAKQQIGDGKDNFGQAAGKAAQAAKQISQEAAKQAAVKGAEATANAAAATVQAGVEGGKAVAEIAAGTAAGGPWGAITMPRHLQDMMSAIFLQPTPLPYNSREQQWMTWSPNWRPYRIKCSP